MKLKVIPYKNATEEKMSTHCLHFWLCVSYFLPYLTTTQRSKKRSKVGQVQLHENRWILYKFLLSGVKCYYLANIIEYLPTLLRGDQLLEYAKYILPKYLSMYLCKQVVVGTYFSYNYMYNGLWPNGQLIYFLLILILILMSYDVYLDF